jgi:hypothetical protein
MSSNKEYYIITQALKKQNQKTQSISKEISEGTASEIPSISYKYAVTSEKTQPSNITDYILSYEEALAKFSSTNKYL